ncbi:MAG: hypothetical protein ABIW49_03580 [Knoellia sp.]
MADEAEVVDVLPLDEELLDESLELELDELELPESDEPLLDAAGVLLLAAARESVR